MERVVQTMRNPTCKQLQGNSCSGNEAMKNAAPKQSWHFAHLSWSLASVSLLSGGLQGRSRKPKNVQIKVYAIIARLSRYTYTNEPVYSLKLGCFAAVLLLPTHT